MPVYVQHEALGKVDDVFDADAIWRAPGLALFARRPLLRDLLERSPRELRGRAATRCFSHVTLMLPQDDVDDDRHLTRGARVRDLADGLAALHQQDFGDLLGSDEVRYRVVGTERLAPGEIEVKFGHAVYLPAPAERVQYTVSVSRDSVIWKTACAIYPNQRLTLIGNDEHGATCAAPGWPFGDEGAVLLINDGPDAPLEVQVRPKDAFECAYDADQGYYAIRSRRGAVDGAGMPLRLLLRVTPSAAAQARVGAPLAPQAERPIAAVPAAAHPVADVAIAARPNVARPIVARPIVARPMVVPPVVVHPDAPVTMAAADGRAAGSSSGSSLGASQGSSIPMAAPASVAAVATSSAALSNSAALASVVPAGATAQAESAAASGAASQAVPGSAFVAAPSTSMLPSAFHAGGMQAAPRGPAHAFAAMPGPAVAAASHAPVPSTPPGRANVWKPRAPVDADMTAMPRRASAAPADRAEADATFAPVARQRVALAALALPRLSRYRETGARALDVGLNRALGPAGPGDAAILRFAVDDEDGLHAITAAGRERIGVPSSFNPLDAGTVDLLAPAPEMADRYCAVLRLPQGPGQPVAPGARFAFGRGAPMLAALRVLDSPRFLTSATGVPASSADRLGLSRNAFSFEASADGYRIARLSPTQALYHLDADLGFVAEIAAATPEQSYLLPAGHHLVAGHYVLRFDA